MEIYLEKLQNKIYSMSNSFLSLDMFFNDIRDNKAENFNKIQAYNDLNIIADFIIDLQFQIVLLKHQLAEKDKEIESLKKADNIWLDSYQNELDTLRQNQTQLAIQELEKVKVNLKDRISMMKNEEHSYLQKVVAWYDICDQINKQIKELKGE